MLHTVDEPTWKMEVLIWVKTVDIVCSGDLDSPRLCLDDPEVIILRLGPVDNGLVVVLVFLLGPLITPDSEMCCMAGWG